MKVTLSTVILLLLGTLAASLATFVAAAVSVAANEKKDAGIAWGGCFVVGIAAIASKLLGIATLIAFIAYLLQVFGVLP